MYTQNDILVVLSAGTTTYLSWRWKQRVYCWVCQVLNETHFQVINIYSISRQNRLQSYCDASRFLITPTFNQNNKQSYISIQHQNKKHPRCKQLNIYKEITVISISKS
jgi:phage FluMu protein Com